MNSSVCKSRKLYSLHLNNPQGHRKMFLDGERGGGGGLALLSNSALPLRYFAQYNLYHFLGKGFATSFCWRQQTINGR